MTVAEAIDDRRSRIVADVCRICRSCGIDLPDETLIAYVTHWLSAIAAWIDGDQAPYDQFYVDVIEHAYGNGGVDLDDGIASAAEANLLLAVYLLGVLPERQHGRVISGMRSFAGRNGRDQVRAYASSRGWDRLWPKGAP